MTPTCLAFQLQQGWWRAFPGSNGASRSIKTTVLVDAFALVQWARLRTGHFSGAKFRMLD